MNIKPGDTFYMKHRIEKKIKYHIVAVIVDNNEDLIVYKWWSKPKQCWKYEADLSYLFVIDFEVGKYWWGSK